MTKHDAMSHRDSREERLMEEIANHLVDVYGGAFSSPSYRILSKRIIVLIISAVHDGRLDEELGVVGRFEFHMRRWDDFEAWAAEMLSIVGTSEFIALSGTGKEENE